MIHKRNFITFTSVTLALTAVYMTSLYNYLLFHSIAEMFSIVISFAIFMFAWNSRRFHDSEFFIFIGITYFFIGMLDFLHTLSYQGMNIFRDYDYYANQLWIGTRYLESISLAVAFLFIESKDRKTMNKVFALYAVVFALLVLSVFYWKVFPVCFIEGEGLTTFKKVSEYIICLILLSGMLLLKRNKSHFNRKIYRLLLFSFIFTVMSELAFTFYVSNYGISNLAGHYFKIFSFYMIYKAIIETGIVKPFDLLFRNLQNNQRSLEKSTLELKELNANKDKFFSIISHDLRNPLTSIFGLADLLSKKADTFPKEKIMEVSGYIYLSAKRLFKLLENLLQWSSIQQGKMPYSPEGFPVSRLIESNMTLLAGNAEKKDIKLVNNVRDDIYVLADSNMVNSVIQNLITNAIKFTDCGGSVTVDAAAHGETVEIKIADTGRGMDETLKESLFRIDSNISTSGTEGEKGTGLGLILCRELMQKNNGEISVESSPGKGSVFSLTLPGFYPARENRIP